MSTIKGIESGRANFAYQCVDKKGKEIEKPKEYKAYAKKIPMMIKNNGLGATLAFLFSKGMKEIEKGGQKKIVPDQEKAYGLLYHQIANWFINHRPYLVPGLEKHQDLVKLVIELDSTAYRAATIEVLALFNWIRRFADGLIEGESED